ncbi:MAG: DUF427 domain-containing protein [Acidimicrobiales bacterium]
MSDSAQSDSAQSDSPQSDQTQRGRVRVEPCAKRVRTYLAGRLVAESTNPLLVWEGPYYPVYYFSLSAIRAELVSDGTTEHSPSRGDAEVCDVKVAEHVARRAARRFSSSPIEQLRDHVRFEWDLMDEWMEEDEPVYTHARDPHTRVDTLTSSRHVRVEVSGTTVADTTRPLGLFETGLPTRWYMPMTDLRMDLLEPSETVSHCPYKGTATYWSLDVGGRLYEDLVWCYRTPLPECQKIAGLACFYNEKVDLYVDGVLEERPRTKFS